MKYSKISVNFDVLEHIIRCCDVESSISLLYSSKIFYTVYLSGQFYIQRIICEKICEKYDLGFFVDSEDICKELMYLHTVIKNKESYTFGEILRALCPRVTEENGLLFTHCISACKLKFWPTDSKNKKRNDMRIISTTDLEYILFCGNELACDIILSELFIPTGIISHCIINLLNRMSLYDKQNIQYEQYIYKFKITKYLNYMISNNSSHFDMENTVYFDEIVQSIIEHNQFTLLTPVIALKRKYKLSFDYNTILNRAVQLDNISVFRLLFAENRLDMSDQPLTNIIITPESLQSLISIGHLYSLSYILSYILGSRINQRGYIKGICEGLNRLFSRESEDFIFRNIYKLGILSAHLTTDNRVFINKHLTLLQWRLGVTNRKFFSLYAL